MCRAVLEHVALPERLAGGSLVGSIHISSRFFRRLLRWVNPLPSRETKLTAGEHRYEARDLENRAARATFGLCHEARAVSCA